MNDRARRTAKQFNILDRITKLETELLSIEGVTEVEFDLDGFYDNLNEVILLTKYDIPVSLSDYFDRHKKLISNVLKVAYDNDLRRTGDSIEDYGRHYYFVMSCRRWEVK